MGKGYNNYMCKKPFHPGSKANIKRTWMAEQKTENDKRKQEELKVQYEKEQDLYNNRALISSESKDKLELNFMYEAPPGAKRERQREDDEPEFKFEWQRKYNAPREDYCKGNEDIKDQPFGIPVRNVRCIKCHKWGHINTDKECPLYNQVSTSSMPTTSMDPLELMRQMKEDGFSLKESVLGHQLNPAAANQQFVASEESDPEMDFLKSLSTAEKKKLLRKLKKISKKQAKSSKKKKSKKNKKSRSIDSSSDSEEEEKIRKKKKLKKSSSSESDSSSSVSERKKNKRFDAKKPSIKKEKQTPGKIETLKKIPEFNFKTKSEHQSPEKSKNETIRRTEYKEFKKNSSNYAPPHSKLKNKEAEEFTDNQKKEDSQNTDKTKARHYSSSEDESQKANFKRTKYNDSSSLEKESAKNRKCDNFDSENSCDSKILDLPVHPDGFSHFCPQAVIKENYLLVEEEYKGKTHDRFRHLNRDKRSPSVKQKYNK